MSGATTLGPWRVACVLSCQHKTEVEIGVFPTFEEGYSAPDDLPSRADGWPKAMRCDECNRLRAVTSLLMARVR